MAYLVGYDARTIANQFLSLGERDCVPIDPMKIQKLMYLAHGWSLAFFDSPLVLQAIEAWRYGPVVPDLYREFQVFRANPIVGCVKALGTISEQTREHLENVWQTYKAFTPIQLSMMTHEPGGAWDLTTKKFAGTWGSPIIPNELIAEEFKQRKQRG